MKKQICVVFLLIFIGLTSINKLSQANSLKFSDKEVNIFTLKIDNFEQNHQYIIDFAKKGNLVLDYYTEDNYLSIIAKSSTTKAALERALNNEKGIHYEIIKTTTEKIKQK